MINHKTYMIKNFNRKILSPDLNSIENSASNNLIISSPSVEVQYIHSGNLEVNLSNPLNLKHPSCSGINNEEIQVPINAYLLHHKKYGYFLIDTGCESAYTDNAYGPMKGLLLSLFVPKTKLEPYKAIENQLSEEVLHNLKAVFFTHLHADHTSGLPALPENLIYIAGKGEKSYSVKGLIDFQHFRKSDTVYMLDFDKEISETFPIGKAIDIFGDQTVWAISTPGHSKGHVSYLINREDRPVLIAGDACILNKSLELGVGSGTSSADSEQDQKTIDKIVTFIKNNPNVEVWCGHDFPK
jgi:glyoxylase-like metal-dependent hydrolase (beta-lactamase superfamily II)